ncbi:MAG: hypothetical protein QJR09_08070 [Micrococcus sp.]|nr:hypothetical protein [Micrococcus sp.]
MSGHELITEYMILPTGMDPGDVNATMFAVHVKYRGQFNGRSGGGYSVNHLSSELSRAGKWGLPQRFQRWQYRWEAFWEAQDMARDVVDSLKVNGRTWAEWQAERTRA